MEAGEDNYSSANLKRQRAPLSDSEDNVFLPSEVRDGQKRRRLEAAGQENQSPKSSTSRRLVEQETKPDTPMVPSIRSRVVQLTQRQDGGPPLAQRCLSDPGADSPSNLHRKGFKEHLLSEGEFNQRLERFKVPDSQASPASALSQANHSPRPCSNFVSDIQQKLQCSTTPSSQQASRLREERKQELSRLQPISQNAWLIRSTSDPSLAQADGDAEFKDGSFTEMLTSASEKQSFNGTGKSTLCDTPAVSISLENCDGQAEGKEKHTCQEAEVRAEEKLQASCSSEASHHLRSQAVLKLSFSEDQSFSGAQSSGKLPTGDEQSLSEVPHPDEWDMMETGEDDESVQDTSEAASCENITPCSCSEDEIEPSTDEELRLWRYPQGKVWDEEKSEFRLEERKDGAVGEEADLESTRAENHKESDRHPDSRADECRAAGGSTEITGSSETQEEDAPGDERSRSDYPAASSADQSSDELLGGAGTAHSNDTGQPASESSPPRVGKDLSVGGVAAKRDQQDEKEEQEVQHRVAQGDDDVELEHGGQTQRLPEVQVSGPRSGGDVLSEEQDGVEELADGSVKAQGGESSKKVTFVLEPELIGDYAAETHSSDAELSSHDETNTAEIIDQMFGEVLEYAGMMEQEKAGKGEDLDSGIGTCADDKATTGTESGKEKNEDEEEEDGDEEDGSGDELLTFPSSGILSPLSKSVEAVVTPLRLAVDQGSNPPPLLEETPNPPPEAAPLYSVDAYRTQRQVKKPAAQSITPVQKQVPLQPQPQPSVKAKITALNEEAGKLQTVINQTLQALSCCTDEEHGRGSLEEAEAEKLLLVSCEKRSALLAEVARLRAERSSESGEDGLHSSLQPCRGTVSISNIQLPLKVEFVCSSHNKSGRPSHYFFVLIRYGPCNIVATPLATAADAQNGDTISFPTAVTLKDIRSSFEIDVEVYSLSHTSSTNCNMDRPAAKSRVTPRKLLNTLTRSSNSLTAAAPLSLHARRSSNFSLVGSHKITLASLGHSKFPLDKMKLDGKIRRLLGDEFQEKVPFLSPLEGNIYLRLDSQSHTNIQHQGFLTMFELLSGYGVWHRRYFVLEGCTLYYWNHPNDREAKAAEGRISLSSSPHRHVRPVERDSCARPFTFELVNDIQQRKDGSSQDNANAKCWFSADTKQEKLDWIEKLSQALLDLHTWSQASRPARSQQSEPSSSENLRESIL
ncbi:anillin, actin binding protein 2 isoform X3 [Nelusetta ayraudi]|uniref:anillin, actin binding protein 2 isoform X3 n=1 Tax=Nelusetta ayraudi TaxID=303726 RepID=UPI003F6FB583